MPAMFYYFRNPISPLFARVSAEPNSDILLTEQIELFRCLAGYKFPIQLEGKQREEVTSQIVSAIKSASTMVKSGYFMLTPEELSLEDQMFAAERQWVRAEYGERGEYSLIAVTRDGKIVITANEKISHLRIRAAMPEKNFGGVWKQVSSLDDELNRKLIYAFDKKMGYLNSNLHSVGTGLQATAYLHLPALCIDGKDEELTNAIRGSNCVLSRVFSSNDSDSDEKQVPLYRLMNEFTLGLTEEEILSHVNAIATMLQNAEIEERERMLTSDRGGEFVDKIGRAYGTLLHSYNLTFLEAAAEISTVALGASAKLFKKVDLPRLARLATAITDSNIASLIKMGEVDDNNPESVRAALCRDMLTEM